MKKNQVNICNKTLQELKELYIEKNHFYDIVDVYYKPSGNQLKKWVLLNCNEHSCMPFEQSVQDAFLLRRSKKCPECLSIIQTMNSRVSITELNERIQNSTNPSVTNKQIVIKYLNNSEHKRNSVVLVKCNLFGHHKKSFPQTAVSIGKNNICPECIKTRKYMKKEGENLLLKINNILNKKNNSFYFLGEIERSDKGVIFYELVCKKCSCSEWEREKYITSVKCKICHPYGTKGESIIHNYLTQKSIVFDREKKFDDLKNKQNLECDFYIPKFNLLIEFDGLQHEKPNSHFQGKHGFFKKNKNDWIKNRYAYYNNFNLLRISQKEINNIKLHIDKALEKINNGERVYKIAYTPIFVTKRKKFITLKKNRIATLPVAIPNQ